MTAAIVAALLSAAAAFVGAWLAARFALNRFYFERIWERRAATYTAVFEALHDQMKWYTVAHATMLGREITGEEAAKLSAEYQAALRSMKRRIDAEAWLVSDDFNERISKLLQDVNQYTQAADWNQPSDWYEHFEHGAAKTESAIEDLRKIARRELQVPLDRFS